MSEIRYVDRLGDAIEAAAWRRIAARRSRIRRLLVGVTGAAVLGASVTTAAAILDDSQKLAAGGVYCYDTADLDGGADAILAGDRSPVAACAAEIGRTEPRVACSDGETVAVVPGRSPATCARLGLAPLPATYQSARERTAAFAEGVRAIEASARCIPPDELARRVQALLDRSGWSGWTTWLRLDVSDGPCGSVSGRNGDGTTSVEPSLDVDGRRVMIFGGPPRSS